MFIAPIAFAAGAASWGATEYFLHCYVGHGPKRAPRERWYQKFTPGGFAAEFNREHLAHHTDPMYFAPGSHKAIAASVGLAVIGGAGSLLFGPVRGFSFALGYALAYGGYEVLHALGRPGQGLRRCQHSRGA